MSRSRTKKLKFKKRLFSKHLALILSAIVFAVIGVRYLLHSLAATTNIDTTSQSAVNNAYWSLYAPSLAATAGWTGSVPGCNSGTMSATARSAEIDAINFIRRLQHLAPIRLANSIVNANDLKAGLLLEANHVNLLKGHPSPTTDWKCYKSASAGADAISKSNLGNDGDNVGQNMNDMMSDYGNISVSHRRWLSFPEATAFGVGATNNYTVVQVLGPPTSSTNPSPAVMWPMKGYFPSTLAPANLWSYSSGGKYADFSSATVRVTHNGNPVNVTRYDPYDGYGRPTLVWAMPLGYSKSGSYTVKITNKYTGSVITTYVVRFFKPVQP